MQHRDRESYLSMFQWIQSIYQTEFPDRPSFKPEKFYSDLEPAFLSAVASYFPESPLNFCMVHVETAWDKKLKECFGMDYRIVTNLRKLLYILVGAGWCSKNGFLAKL